MIGICDCCQAVNVELSFGTVAGLETWSCYEGCKPAPARAIHDALTKADLEYSAMSWGGFNLFGDRKSIDEAKRLQHAAGTVEALRDALKKAEDRATYWQLIADGERERCAKIAEAHKGSAARKRKTEGRQLHMGSEAYAEIVSEERGEDIASEMIARAIRGA